ncbi:MAG: hypothetical protein JSS98_00055 [Bacteroidetes bacterium]|nr:hypothetical protein [Bacteroidota bacterium]
MAKSNTKLTQVVSESLKQSFDIDKFKKSKFLGESSKFKKQKWIPFSEAMREALSIPGVPMGHIFVNRGGSDTGKTTLMIEVASTAQKMGILPVFIITEQKWDFTHAQKMGLQLEEIPDAETGEVMDYKGFFIYVDRTSLNSIEDVAAFIADMLNEQREGKLPFDLLFLWDSSGSIPCKMSIEQGNNNPMWNAGAMATQFGNFINQQFPLSRKEKYPYTNTFFVINKTGVQPALTQMSQPRMTNKGGNAMYWDATIVATFGNVTNSGTSKISVQHKGKKVEFAKRTKVAIDKIHTDYGIATASTVIVTPHGFIPDTPDAVKEYKKQHAHEWFNEQVDVYDLIQTEDNSEWLESSTISPVIEIDKAEE